MLDQHQVKIVICGSKIPYVCLEFGWVVLDEKFTIHTSLLS